MEQVAVIREEAVLSAEPETEGVQEEETEGNKGPLIRRCQAPIYLDFLHQ